MPSAQLKHCSNSVCSEGRREGILQKQICCWKHYLSCPSGSPDCLPTEQRITCFTVFKNSSNWTTSRLCLQLGALTALQHDLQSLQNTFKGALLPHSTPQHPCFPKHTVMSAPNLLAAPLKPCQTGYLGEKSTPCGQWRKMTFSNNVCWTYVFVWGLCSQNKHPKSHCSNRKCRVSYFILCIYRPNGNLNTRFPSLPYKHKCTVLRFIVLLRRVGWLLDLVFVCLLLLL